MRGWRPRKRAVTRGEMRERRGDGPDPQDALEPAPGAGSLLPEAVEVRERALRPDDDALALRRQALEVAPAPHQRDAELALEAPDARREGRLRDVAGRRGAAEMALAVEGRQVLELTYEHGIMIVL